MQRFDFVAKWVPGKTNVDADALSRAPVAHPSKEDELAEGPLRATARQAIIAAIEGSAATVIGPVLEKIKQAAAKDSTMIDLKEMILNRFPNER